MNDPLGLFISAGGAALLILLCHLIGGAWWEKSEKRVLSKLYVDLPGDYWTPTDSAAWLTFRGTPSGRKLGTILNNTVAASAVSATLDKEHAAHSCGRACGVRDTVQVLDMLLPEPISPAGAQPGKFEGSADQGAADSLAHLAP